MRLFYMLFLMRLDLLFYFQGPKFEQFELMMKANIDLTNNELYYLEREKLELDEPTASH